MFAVGSAGAAGFEALAAADILDWGWLPLFQPLYVEGAGMAGIGGVEATGAAGTLTAAGYNTLVVSGSWGWVSSNLPWLVAIVEAGQAVVQSGGGPITEDEIFYLVEHGYCAVAPYIIPANVIGL
jgi:hypothetical protein